MKGFDNHLPRSIKVDSYADVISFIEGFVAGKLNLLFLIGRSGLGKSQLAQRALDGRRYAWFDSHATKLSLYIKAYRHRDQPIVIDDENSMMTDSSKLDLLNSLCQTNPIKTIRWDSTTRILEEQNVPPEFKTSSPVLIITNKVRALSPQVLAMIDRGLPMIFQPSTATIHEAVADWFTDREVYNFIGEWLKLIPGLSMRDYVKGERLKAGRYDWRSLLHRQWKSSRLARVVALRLDPSFKSEEDRVAAFVAEGLGSRATYFRCLLKLRDLGVIPDRTMSGEGSVPLAG